MARNDQRGPAHQGQPQGPGGTAVASRSEPTGAGLPRIKAVLEQASARVAGVLPRHLTPERMIQVAMVQCYRTPKLAECDPNTILAAVVRASSLGLDLEPAMCEAYLIPRWNEKARANECQFQVGYQGLRKLALQGGQVAYIRTALVYDQDEFDYYFDPELHFRHRPAPTTGRGPVVAAYSHAKLPTGDNLIEVMAVDEINAIMLRSKRAITNSKTGYCPTTPWDTDWGEMARKTLLRRHCKSLPRSTELDAALRYDDELYSNLTSETAGVVQAPPARGMLGRSRHRGLAALHARGEAEWATPPAPEPEFAPGVSRPIYSEPDDEPPPPDDDLPEGRMPGEDQD